VLPGPAAVPVGGLRTVYRLAAGLTDRGHAAEMLHPVAWLGTPASRGGTVRRALSFAKHWLLRDYTPQGWLPIARGLRLRVVPSVARPWVRRGDVVIATSWRTMERVHRLPPDCGAKAAYVQHLESWDGGEEAVREAWRLPSAKIATARWLVAELAREGQAAEQVPPSVDHDLFFLTVPPEERRAPTVALMAHGLPWKGTSYALAALAQVRDQVPALHATVFATAGSAFPTPPSVEVVLDPTPERLRMLYNSAQVFIAPSFSEGWDLPACEAMACGAAVVASDIPVREEYVTDGDNALLFPAGDATALARAVIRLLGDHELRHRVALRGVERMQAFTWDRSTGLLEAVLLRLVSAGNTRGALQ
jgi:glycosyltransferase involved in cell wall biosynthesis